MNSNGKHTFQLILGFRYISKHRNFSEPADIYSHKTSSVERPRCILVQMTNVNSFKHEGEGKVQQMHCRCGLRS